MKSRVIIGICSLAILLAAMLFRNELVSMLLIGVFALVAFVVLYKDIANLANVSEHNPKTKTLRSLAIFGICALALIVLVFVLFEKGVIQLTAQQEGIIAPIVVAALVLGFGNIAPKIPFNRYIGLRLPWTVRDEESWIIAHRLLGWLSLPCGILCFVGLGSLEKIPVIMLFVWGGIPAIVSFIHFSKKSHPKT